MSSRKKRKAESCDEESDSPDKKRMKLNTDDSQENQEFMSTLQQQIQTVQSLVDRIRDSTPIEDKDITMLRLSGEGQELQRRIQMFINHCMLTCATIFGNEEDDSDYDLDSDVFQNSDYVQDGNDDLVPEKEIRKKENDDLEFRRLFRNNPLFQSYQEAESEEDSDNDVPFFIGYFLKNKYNNLELNKFSFKELGEKCLLAKEDMSDMNVWEICNHFGFETELLAWSKTWGPDVCREQGRSPLFRRRSVERSWKGWYHFIPNKWDSTYGVGVSHAKIDLRIDGKFQEQFDMCPVVQIAIPADFSL